MPNQLADAILKILIEGELRERPSAKAVDRTRLFCWEKMAKETAKVYSETIGKI